ncbi:hypothetical protein FKV68_20700 (plasmid) [Sinorhizobium mexicanum]|uniref:Uncharacterized protein n=1 Tax=Sinorhizobium mexicanum TaxID=375549 RepID=A0A859QFG1_9HYPH|nr:hypothetical protein FKV68_20700 [Sinorhizobium mexicanum]
MTRHDMLQPQAAGAQTPATDPRVPMAIIDADRATTSRVPGRQHRAEAQRSGPSASNLLPPGDAPAIADICRNPKSP